MAPVRSLPILLIVTGRFIATIAAQFSSIWEIPPSPGMVPGIAGNSLASTPLFHYETIQLTPESLAALKQEAGDHVGKFDFQSGDDQGQGQPLKEGQCRTFPGDNTWPTADVWQAFNQALSGSLVPTIPLAAPCYRTWGIYDEAKCAAVIRNFSNPYLHALTTTGTLSEADPTSIMWPLWQGRTCLPKDNPEGNCTLGGYPAYVVNVTSVAHIQLAVNFARNANLRLVIKNTGHCYLGKSSGAGSLSVWTHNLKNIEFLPEYQSKEYSGDVLKVGAGVTVREIYAAAHKNNVTVLGGICESVGYTGGYIAGGGHNPMSGLYGMAADHVMALEVVTADGRFVTASNTSNPDLYWALRGGGGSTFGVVTSAIVRVHPKIPIVTSVFSFGTSDNVSDDTFWEGVRAYFELFIPFTDAGTYSYFWVYNENGTVRLDMKPFWAPGHTIESFNQLVKPWFDRLKELKIPFQPVTKSFDSFYPAYHDNWGNETVGRWNNVPANRLFPRGNWGDPSKLNATFGVLRRHTETSTGRTWGGYHQAPRNRANVDNAVSSAFRHVVGFFITSVPLELGASVEEVGEASRVLVEERMKPWRDVAPETEFGGSYLNEGTPMEPNWQANYYGVQYPRLLEIKKKWDPHGVFYATTAVGSEGWEVRDGNLGTQTQNGRLCRV